MSTTAIGLAFPLLLVLSLGMLMDCVSSAEMITVDWTIEGASKYSVTPLVVRLGDELIMVCSKFVISNFIYLEHREQYDTCNASAVKGSREVTSRPCYVNLTNITTISQSIQRLSSDFGGDQISYTPGKEYYFVSFADGTAGGFLRVDHGGQCLEGLKMIVSVAPQQTSVRRTATTEPSQTPNPGEPEGNSNKDSNNTSLKTVIIIGGAVGATIFLIAVIVIAILCFLVVKREKRRSIDLAESNEDHKNLHSASNRATDVSKRKEAMDDAKISSNGTTKADDDNNTNDEKQETVMSSVKVSKPVEKPAQQKNKPPPTNKKSGTAANPTTKTGSVEATGKRATNTPAKKIVSPSRSADGPPHTSGQPPGRSRQNVPGGPKLQPGRSSRQNTPGGPKLKGLQESVSLPPSSLSSSSVLSNKTSSKRSSKAQPSQALSLPSSHGSVPSPARQAPLCPVPKTTTKTVVGPPATNLKAKQRKANDVNIGNFTMY